jgi:FkbM family methyltransferase
MKDNDKMKNLLGIFNKHKKARLMLARDNGFMYACGVLSMGDKQTFQTYFLQNNMPEKIAVLKNGLDAEAAANCDRFLQRLLILPDMKVSGNYKIKREFLDGFMTEKEKAMTNRYWSELPEYKSQILLPNACDYNPDTMLFHHGLRFANDKIKEYIADKDFIDGGAYIGDTMIILSRNYAPKCVWSFELSAKNCETYKQVAANNNISSDKYRLVPMGISDKKQTIEFSDIGGQGATIVEEGAESAQITDLDSFVSENNLNVGFIKADVEGVGLEALAGMRETIRKFRPVVMIAMYHNPKEFFGIKPLLEEITDGANYKITIQQFHPFSDCLNEVSVFAYPAELGEYDNGQ